MFSKFFIERPIFATVVSLIIVIAGLVAMKALPVAQYPTITPVQVQVTTTYPGADSKTVGDSVAAPIEAQINGVDNMLYMTSTSSNTGQMTITVYFTLEHGSRHRPGAGAEPREPRHAAAPRSRHAVRRLGAEEVVQHLDDHFGLQQGRPVQPGLCDQLYQCLHPGCDQAGERRGPGADLRRAGPGDAHLDEPGPDGLPRRSPRPISRMRSPNRTPCSGPARSASSRMPGTCS